MPVDPARHPTPLTSVTVGWQPSTDNVGVTAYDLTLDGTAAGSTPVPSATFSGLACGETHEVWIRAATPPATSLPPPRCRCARPAPCPASVFIAPGGVDFLWTHLATTYDGSTLTLYVNGVPVSSSPVTGTITPSSDPLWIGGNPMWGGVPGLIDDVRVYDRALDQTHVRADMAAPVVDGPVRLVAAYGFDDGSGSLAADASGNDNVGEIDGADLATDGHTGGALSVPRPDVLDAGARPDPRGRPGLARPHPAR